MTDLFQSVVVQVLLLPVEVELRFSFCLVIVVICSYCRTSFMEVSNYGCTKNVLLLGKNVVMFCYKIGNMPIAVLLTNT